MASRFAWWSRRSPRQRRVIVVLAALGVLWLVDVLGMRSLRVALAELRREVRGAEQELIDAMVASGQEASVAEARTAYQTYLDQPRRAAEAELAAVLTEVESAVRDAGIILLNLQPTEQAEPGATRVSVRVQTEASPSQLVQLLDRLQRSVQLLKVREVDARVVENRVLRASLVISKLVL